MTQAVRAVPLPTAVPGMQVLVTGATGFIGRHLVRRLLDLGHGVKAVARDQAKAQAQEWFGRVSFEALDIHACDVGKLVRGVDAIAHLAWHGLPNYRERFHFEQNLPRDQAFLRAAVEAGARQIMVTGTCLEYGPHASGCLHEDTPTEPVVAYALAKDALRRFLEALRGEQAFRLQWVRLFYSHGPGQAATSLLAQLDRAHAEGRTSFDLSGGEQLRDYLHVDEVAARLARVITSPTLEGCINCCSGVPISVRRLVEEHLRARGIAMDLRFGVHPYPDYEPFAFWGAGGKLEHG